MRIDKAVKHTGDFRNVLDDPAVDAVVIATPDHWHAPAAILACEAGKHVYVEKPCSHTVREGRLLIEAAKRNKTVVQHGTQVRSTDMMIEAIELLRSGIIGDVKVAKCWNVQRRANIGKQQPGKVPDNLDYENWVGPAEWLPYQQNRVNSGWHWFYPYGTGDMGNDGVHDMTTLAGGWALLHIRIELLRWEESIFSMTIGSFQTHNMCCSNMTGKAVLAIRKL